MRGNVSLAFRASKINKKGKSAIVIRITKNKKNTEVSTGIFIKASDWNNTKKCLRVNTRTYNLYNDELNKKLDEASVMLTEMEIENSNFTAKALAQRIKGENNEPSKVIVDYLDDFIKSNKILAKNTIGTYNTTLKRLNEFDSELTFDSITLDHIEKFEFYMSNTLGNRKNTVHGRMKVLRRIMNKAIKEGLTSNYPFKHYKLPSEKTKREYLTIEELNAFSNIQTDNYIETLVRDSFIFGSLTGLRFSDICRCKDADIKLDNDQNKLLELRMKKVDKLITISLGNKVDAIVDFYNKIDRTNTNLLPIITEPDCIEWDDFKWSAKISSKNAYFNSILKTLITRCNINKHISFHCSRHTFAMIGLNDGHVPIEILKEMLGHENINVTQIYASATQEKVNEKMKFWNNII